MQIDFSQEFPLVDPFPGALFRRMITVHLLDLCLYLFFGHCWREGGAEGGRRGCTPLYGAWRPTARTEAENSNGAHEAWILYFARRVYPDPFSHEAAFHR